MYFPIVTALLALLSHAAFAQEPMRGIFCDTQAQLEKVVLIGTAEGNAGAGIEAVNKSDGEHACVYTTILGVRGKVVATVASPEGLLDIVTFRVQAIATPIGMIPVEERLWFTLVSSDQRAT